MYKHKRNGTWMEQGKHTEVVRLMKKNHHTNASAPHHRRDVVPGGSRPTSKLGRLCSWEGSSCCSYSWSPGSLMMFLHACSLVCETPKYRRGHEDGGGRGGMRALFSKASTDFGDFLGLKQMYV